MEEEAETDTNMEAKDLSPENLIQSYENSDDGSRASELGRALDDQTEMNKAYMSVDLSNSRDCNDDDGNDTDMSGAELSSNCGSVSGLTYSPHNGSNMSMSPRYSPSKTRRKSDKVD